MTVGQLPADLPAPFRPNVGHIRLADILRANLVIGEEERHCPAVRTLLFREGLHLHETVLDPKLDVRERHGCRCGGQRRRRHLGRTADESEDSKRDGNDANDGGVDCSHVASS